MQQKVKPPAIGLIVVGVLGILMSLYGFLSGNDPDAMREMFYAFDMDEEAVESGVDFAGKFMIFGNVLGVVLSGLVVFGAMRMMQLRNRGLALTASIVVMIPCISCCLLGLPIGIWSLIVLLDKDVKAAFDASSTPPNPLEPPPL